MVKIGRFKELIGTPRNNRIRGRDLQIIYGLQGNDKLSAARGSAAGAEATILVGGSGGDRYKAANRTTTIILENGVSSSDTLIARRIGFNRDTSFVGEIDSRHLILGDITFGQAVIVLDWRKADQQLGTFALSDGTYSYGDIVGNFRNVPNYLGNMSWAALQESGAINLRRLGLRPGSINRAIRRAGRRAKKLERQQEQTTRDRLIGIASDDVLVGKHSNGESLHRSQRRQRGDRLRDKGSSPTPVTDELATNPFDLTVATDTTQLGSTSLLSSDALLAGFPANPVTAVFPESAASTF